MFKRKLKINSKELDFVSLKINNGNVQSTIEVAVLNNPKNKSIFSEFYKRGEDNEIKYLTNDKARYSFKNCVLETLKAYDETEILTYVFYADL